MFLQGVKSGEILLSSDILAAGRDPAGRLGDGQRRPTKGKLSSLSQKFTSHS